MKIILLIFILLAFAISITPEFSKALTHAKSSWVAGSFILDLVPSPVEFAFFILVVALISLFTYLVTQLTS